MSEKDPIKSRYSTKVTDNFVTLKEPGDSIHGILKVKGAQLFGDRTVGRYTVENESGRFVFLGSDSLDQQLLPMEIGTDLYIEFMGTVKSLGNRDVKQFEVYIA